VRTADNGQEALKLLSQQNFDAVLMAVQRPLLDGLTTTAIIRAMEKGTPVSHFKEGLTIPSPIAHKRDIYVVSSP
jgi:CheY-like chemotaxis protein